VVISENFPVWVKSGSAAFTDILHGRNGSPIYANVFCFFGDVPDGTWESPTAGKHATGMFSNPPFDSHHPPNTI